MLCYVCGSHWRMGDPEGVLGGLSGGGAAVFLPQLDMVLVARNTPVSAGEGTGGLRDVEVHPVESVQLSLIDQGVGKNKKSTRQSAFNYIGNTLNSFFGDGGEESMAGGEVSREEARRRKLTLKAFFKQGQNVVQLVDLASTHRHVHDVTLPPDMCHINSVHRLQELPQTSLDTVSSWVVSGAIKPGGKMKQGVLSFNMKSKEASFTELSIGLSGHDSVFTERSGGSSAAWRAESLPCSVVDSAAVPFDDAGINNNIHVILLNYDMSLFSIMYKCNSDFCRVVFVMYVSRCQPT
jgi:hypothetical protein